MKFLVNYLKKHKKKISLVLFAFLLPLTILTIMFWNRPLYWMVRSSFSGAKTYPKASVLNLNVGNLDNEQLGSQLTKLKTDFDAQKFTFLHKKDKWTFGHNDLGITFDSLATSQTVWGLNKLSLIDKYRLSGRNNSSKIKPTITVDNEKCVKTLSAISIPGVVSKNAFVYFDSELKISPDETGIGFNAASNCRELPGWLSESLTTEDVFLETIPAGLTKSDLEPNLPKIQDIIGKTLVLKSGSYQKTLEPGQILGLLDVSKVETGVKIGWSETKLDEVISDISSHVNISVGSPALGRCQYVKSYGGNVLDKAATKKFFQELGPESPRTYTLPVSYHEPVFGERTPVAPGGRGTVYLTFDDGLLYGNQIMDYASCYGVKVTFFELGSRVGIDAAGLRRAIAEGHAVQSHGFEHAVYDYGTRAYDWQLNDIAQSISTIMSITGIRPTYFRPPGGNRSANTYTAAAANGINVILWGATASDSSGIGSSKICSNVLSGAFPGASILMHSSKQTTASAVPCIVEGLAARGYSMKALR